MNTHADQIQENKSQSVANGVSQMKSSGEALFQFEDNRPETAIQRKLQQIANNSQKAMQLKAFQEMTSPQSQPTAQLEEMEDGDSKPQQAPVEKPKNNTGLPDNLKSGIENLSGYSMDDVKVHRNSAKPAQLQAHAYAQGSEIHLASGQEKHLPHEAWHVVQQKQGRVKPTKQLKGKVNVNDDKGLEQEADVMGGKAIQKNAISGNTQKSISIYSSEVFQRLRYQAPPNTEIDISGLSLFRLLDYLSRADPDPDPGGVIFDVGDKAVLEHYANIAYTVEFQNIYALLGQPGVAAQAANRNIGNGVNPQQILTTAQTRYNAGNLPGFREWVGGTHTNLNPDNVLDKLNELRAAAGIGGVVNIDETAIAGTPQTADLQHGNEQTEVKTIRNPINGHQDFTGQVSAALVKFAGVPIGGGGNLYNVIIYASINPDMVATHFSPRAPGRTVSIDPNTLIKTVTVITGGQLRNTQIEDTWASLLATLNAGGWAGWDRANKIDIILENGTSRQFNRNLATNIWA